MKTSLKVTNLDSDALVLTFLGKTPDGLMKLSLARGSRQIVFKMKEGDQKVIQIVAQQLKSPHEQTPRSS